MIDDWLNSFNQPTNQQSTILLRITHHVSRNMKKFFLFILSLILLLCLYGIVLVAPVALFFMYAPSSQVFAEALQTQLNTFSTFSIVEKNGEISDTSNTTHSITLTITKEDLDTLLYNVLTAKQSRLITIERVESDISAETIHLAIESHYGLFGWRMFDMTLYSEWMVRRSAISFKPVIPSIVEIKPIDIHTSYLHSVNFVELWNVLEKKEFSNGWIPLPLASELQIEDIILWEDEIAVSIASNP